MRAEASPGALERPRRALLVLVGLIAAAAVATACSSSSKSGGAPSSAPAAASSAAGGTTVTGGSTVEIKNFMFSPMSVTVPVGSTVTWKFEDSTAHNVVADDKSFSSPTLSNGKIYTHAFTTAGTVKYHCSIHPFMTGTIIVQ